MENHKVKGISAGDYQFELCPEGGGCITALRYRGLDVMRPATAAYWENFEPREAASFPLTPYSNRIADGRFSYDGRDYQLPINMPPEPHAIHGDGWQVPWEVEREEPGRITLRHEPKDAAILYRGRQHFDLDENGLNAELEITNTGPHPLPFGFGHHPYFPRSEGLTLKADVDQVWLPDPRKLPRDKITLPEDWNFETPKRLAALDLDHCFSGFGGEANMYWPETGIDLSIQSDLIFGHLVVFVPPGEDFVCVEPVSNVTNAIHQLNDGRNDTGLVILKPGETITGSMRFQAAV